MNKKKIFNDPVYGFITIPSRLIFEIIEHPWFQRLRRIKQLGVAEYVYPGALHTRFHHALGAMHLMGAALHVLREKGHTITPEEEEGAKIAILLHDIGHGPFSHALEKSLLKGIRHEHISVRMMDVLNQQFSGKLSLAMAIFQNTYKKKFLHQLVSSQLDVDRLDYLQRDCYFTGVSEGTIGADRILKMLEVHEDEIVIENKGVYSIENFLNARRIMYWQVYLHKTCISAEEMLTKTILRARYLTQQSTEVPATPPLAFFLKNTVDKKRFEATEDIMHLFVQLDDHDIWTGIKAWVHHPDPVLSFLSKSLLNRWLFKVESSEKPFSETRISGLTKQLGKEFDISEQDARYLLVHVEKSNAAYISKGKKINLRTKEGEVKDIVRAADLPNIKAISKIVKKYYLCWPKNVSL